MTAEKLYTSLLTLEDYSMVIPEGDEEKYDAAIDMLSETDWALPQKVLVEQTKVVFYSHFGQEVKAATTAVVANGETQIKS